MTTRSELEAAIGLYSVVAVALVAMRELARDGERSREAASWCVPQEWVEVLSLWRYKEVRQLNVWEFTQALASLGGHQNRPSDGPPGWLTLWRGWGKLMTMIDGWHLARRCGEHETPVDGFFYCAKRTDCPRFLPTVFQF